MPEIVRIRPADAEHQVVTIEGGGGRGYRRKPCPHCPWRTDQPVGRFPAEAMMAMLRHSFGFA